MIGEKRRITWLVIIFLILIPLTYGACQTSAGDDLPSCDPSSEEFWSNPDNINQLDTSQIAQYPDRVKQDSNWNALDQTKKSELYRDHYNQFSDKLSQEFSAKGITLTDTAGGQSYDTNTGTLTTKDGSNIQTNTFGAGDKIAIDTNGRVTINDKQQLEKATNIRKEGNNIVSDQADKGRITGTDNTDFTKAQGITMGPNGDYTITSADSIQITSSTPQGPTTTTIVSGKNIKYNNGKITVEQASLILEDFAITNQPRHYVTDFNEFTTETAEMVYYRGIMVYDVVNTTFRIGNEKIAIIPLNKNVIHINDTNENNIHYKPINDITK